jgi:4-hydroxy-4-methyl-2-oxoglutarate aldolase
MSIEKLDPRFTTISEFTRPTTKDIAAAAAISTATLHEAAGKIGAFPSAIKPVHPQFQICGPAITVQSPPGDNLWLHRALYAARPGDVLVVHVAGKYEHGYWGEVMSTAAKARHLAGLVIDGCVRDHVLLGEIGFPVFARGLCIRGTSKDFGARGFINHPALFGDTVVAPGDLIRGDADGVVAIPAGELAKTIGKARDRDDWEASICHRLMGGETTLQLFGWETEVEA